MQSGLTYFSASYHSGFKIMFNKEGKWRQSYVIDLDNSTNHAIAQIYKRPTNSSPHRFSSKSTKYQKWVGTKRPSMGQKQGNYYQQRILQWTSKYTLFFSGSINASFSRVCSWTLTWGTSLENGYRHNGILCSLFAHDSYRKGQWHDDSAS